MPRKRPQLVRYVSPFGSPAWMPEDEAKRRLDEDDKRWLDYSEAGILSDMQKQIGPPRIERPPFVSFRASDYPSRLYDDI